MNFNKISAQQFSENIFSLQGISRKTIEDHLKLYQGYVNKYNEINEAIGNLVDADYVKANQVYSQVRELKLELSFAWGGVVNHEIYFSHLGTTGSRAPEGALLTQLKNDFGSLELFQKDLKATAIAARGWAFTIWNEKEKRLMNHLSDSQNTYLIWSAKPILALDVYEHAYFADFGVNRAAYIDVFFNNLDWAVIEKNFELAKK